MERVLNENCDAPKALTSQSSQHFPPAWSHCKDVSVGSTDGSLVNKGKCVWEGVGVWVCVVTVDDVQADKWFGVQTCPCIINEKFHIT